MFYKTDVGVFQDRIVGTGGLEADGFNVIAPPETACSHFNRCCRDTLFGAAGSSGRHQKGPALVLYVHLSVLGLVGDDSFDSSHPSSVFSDREVEKRTDRPPLDRKQIRRSRLLDRDLFPVWNEHLNVDELISIVVEGASDALNANLSSDESIGGSPSGPTRWDLCPELVDASTDLEEVMAALRRPVGLHRSLNLYPLCIAPAGKEVPRSNRWS